MKFEKHQYWKHVRCLDVFYSRVEVVADQGKCAILRGSWCTQGSEGWWFVQPQRLVIKPKEYDNWRPYELKGMLKL